MAGRVHESVDKSYRGGFLFLFRDSSIFAFPEVFTGVVAACGVVRGVPYFRASQSLLAGLPLPFPPSSPVIPREYHHYSAHLACSLQVIIPQVAKVTVFLSFNMIAIRLGRRFAMMEPERWRSEHPGNHGGGSMEGLKSGNQWGSNLLANGTGR